MSARRWSWLLAPRRRLGFLAGLVVCGLLVMASAASAATFTVNDSTDAALSTPSDTACVSTDGGGCTLRAAVQAADNTGGASTITLPAGDDKLTIAATAADDPSNGDLDINNTAQVTITGAGSGSTTVDANQIDRAFAVQIGAGLSLSGMTIENGSPSSSSTGSQYGGAIYSNGALALTGDVTLARNNALSSSYGGGIYAGNDPGSSLALAGVTFNRNSAYYGGAVYDDTPGTASITASSFTNNLASDDEGGAIYGDNGAMTIDSSQFSHNNAEYGGGIYWDANAALAVTNSSFTANSTSEYGGALYDNDSTSTTLTNDRFIDNAGGEYGGALYLDANSSTVYTLDQDEFDGNSAGYEEGGAVDWEEGSLSSHGSSFINNTGYYGGALYADSGGALTLVNATISDNTSSYGGGIYFDTATPTAMTNDTITGNSAQPGEGGGIYGPSDATLGTGTGVQNTIVAKNAGGDCNSTFAAASDTGHNLDSDATCFGSLGVAGDITGVNPLVGDPADNGGPVLTDRLLAGSPAIDAGTNTNCPATDARGVTRPEGAACDLGAYEAAAAGLSLTKTAPASVTVANPFDYTLTSTANGPAPATGTTVTDQLPAGMTLYGATASQGSCTSTGSPAKLTCDLGTVATGASATVVLVVADANTGSVTNTATATDDQGASVTAAATTQVNPAAGAGIGTAPSAGSARASSVTHTTVTLNGTVSAGGQATAYFFQYGKNRSFGQATSIQHTTTSQNVTAQLKGLAPRTRYQYRLVAINATGVSYGATMRFKTATWRPRLTLRVRSTHPATAYRYTLTGRLRLPKGVTKTLGCSGTVTITITQGAHRIASHRAAVGRGCSYRTTFTTTKTPAKNTKVKATYNGNHTLSATKGKLITLPRA